MATVISCAEGARARAVLAFDSANLAFLREASCVFLRASHAASVSFALQAVRAEAYHVSICVDP